MFRTFFVLTVIAKVQSHAVPLIYAAPSAVSHQSRIDIKHDPGFISPVVYTPAILPSHLKVASEAVVAPIVSSHAVLAPVALSFFHNLPLARALEHPISIDVIQNSYKKENSENIDQRQSDKETSAEALLVQKVSENVIQHNKQIPNMESSNENVAHDPENKLLSLDKES